MCRSSSCLLVVRRQLAVMRQALVVGVRDEVEHVLFEIRARAADGVHLAAPDHFGQRDAELGRAHRAGQRDEHLAAGFEVRDVRVRRIFQDRRIEMTEVTIDECRDGARAGAMSRTLPRPENHDTGLRWVATARPGRPTVASDRHRHAGWLHDHCSQEQRRVHALRERDSSSFHNSSVERWSNVSAIQSRGSYLMSRPEGASSSKDLGSGR